MCNKIHGVNLGEFGVYSLNITGDGNCTFDNLKSPVFEYGGECLVCGGVC